MGRISLVASNLVILGLGGILVSIIAYVLGMIIIWDDRGSHDALPFGALFLVAALVSLAYLGEMLSPSYVLATSWSYALASLQAVIPVAWVVVTISLVGSPASLRGWRLAVLMFVPLLTLLVIAVPPLRSFYWQSRVYVRVGGALVAHHHYNGWAWVQFGYTALLTLAGVRLWLKAQHRDSPVSIRVGLGIAFVALVTVIPFFLQLFGFSNEQQIALIGVGMAISATAAIYSVLGELVSGFARVNRRAVVDTTNMIIVALDQQGHILDMNPAAEAFWGCSLRECIGLDVGILERGSDAAFAQNVQDDQDLRLVVHWDRHPGRDFEVLFQPMIGKRGERLGRLLAVTDVTARVRAEQELAHSQRWYRSILEQSPSMIMVLDQDGRIELVNQTPQGFSTEYMLGQSVYDFVPGDHAERLRSALKQVFEKGENATYEHQGAEDGTWHTNTLAPIAVDGEVSQAALVGTDITALIQAQQALLESEQRYRTIFETAGTGLLIIDEDTTIAMANQLICDMTGYSHEEIVGSPFPQLFAVYEHERMLGYHCERREPDGSAPSTYECAMHQKDGMERIVFLNVSVIPGTKQSVVSVLDVSEQRRTEERLRHALKLEAIGQLAGGVAHDFNNLLTVINGSAEFVIDALQEGSAERADVEEILRSGQRAAELTRQLLAFSRRQVLEMNMLNLNDVLSNVSEMVRRLIGEHIELELDLAPDLWGIYADDAQLEQVVINLCINARDAMPTGGHVYLSTRNCELHEEMTASNLRLAAGRYVVLTIQDTGEGMSPAVLDHLFEPFFTTKEVGKGTGLGLSSVYGIVTQSGGEICCESTVGEGTTFQVYLPVSEINDNDCDTTSNAKAEASFAGETILVVEDQNDVRRLTRRMLENKGYHVIEATDGINALDIGVSYDEPIDVILTDVVMPQMLGPEMIARLRRARHDFVVIYASGYSDQVDEVWSQAERDGDFFLSKPYTADELLGTIVRALATKE